MFLKLDLFMNTPLTISSLLNHHFLGPNSPQQLFRLLLDPSAMGSSLLLLLLDRLEVCCRYYCAVFYSDWVFVGLPQS